MADKPIGQLPVSAGLDDNSLLVTEQGGEARSITGALVKQFAKDAVAEETAKAEQAAKDAAAAKTSVDASKASVDQSKSSIDQTKVAIDGIKTDIDTAKDAIDQAQTDVAKNKTDAEAAAQSAGTSATIAAENAGRVAAALNEADGIVEEVTGLRNESMNTVKSSVLFTEQQLTDEQKSQARENIAAPGKVIDGGGELFNDAMEASGSYSHAEGYFTKAIGAFGSHAEGTSTIASGDCSHAEGGYSEASGEYSHAEGHRNKAVGQFSHAEGSNTEANGRMSHAEGGETVANGDVSHAEGWYTIASGHNQHVQGKYNVEDTEGKYAHIVGNGSSSARSNAHTVDWDGNAWFAGSVFVGGTSQDDGEEAATKQYVDEKATWENLQGKPTIFEGGDTLTWDGDTAGRVSIGDMYFKVSDAVPSKEDCKNGLTVIALTQDMSFEVSGTEAQALFNEDGAALSDFYAIIPNDGYEVSGEVCPEAGIYFSVALGGAVSLTIPGYTGFGKEVIDPDYLPESVKNAAVYVNFTTEDGETFTANKTFAEVETEVIGGKEVIGVLSVDSDTMYLRLEYRRAGEDLIFINMYTTNTAGGLAVTQLTFYDNEAVKCDFGMVAVTWE